MSAKSAFSLLGQRRFIPLLGAQAFGAFNDNLLRIALITAATFQGLTIFDLPTEYMLSIAASAFTVAIALFSAVSGRLADIFDRTLIMRYAKFAEIWLMLLAGIGFIISNPVLLLFALFLMGAQSALFSPARTAALPTLLKEEELVPANALMSGSLNMSVLIGVGLGSSLMALDQGPLMVAVILIGVAALGWVTMRQLPPALPTPPKDPADDPALALKRYFTLWRYPGDAAANSLQRLGWTVFLSPILLILSPLILVVGETVRVLGGVAARPEVFRPLLGAAWFWMLSALIVITVVPVFVRDTLGGDESVVTLFMALFTIGGAIGAISCGALARGGPALPFSIAGGFGIVAFSVLLAVLSSDYEPAFAANAGEFLADQRNIPIVISLVGSAISAGLFVVPLQAMAQRKADPELRGRLLAGGSILNALAATLGQFVLTGIYLLRLPIQAAFYFVAAISVLAALGILYRYITDPSVRG